MHMKGMRHSNCQNSRMDHLCLVRHLDSTSSITFYDGHVDAAIIYLRDRVKNIVGLNSWLGGTLIDNDENDLFCCFKKVWNDALFTVLEDIKINENMNYDTIFKMIRHLLVKRGRDCINNIVEPLYRVIVLKINPTKFAIIHSTCHLICDGHTHYTLFGMLSQSATHISLEHERFSHFEEDTHKLSPYGMQYAMPWILSPGYQWRQYINTFFPINYYFIEVDPLWIELQKQEAKVTVDVPYVTTNDILTTLILSLCKADVVSITINVRNRLPYLKSNNAGNYFDFRGMHLEDFRDPVAVQRANKNNYPFYTKGLPGFWETLRTNIVYITNWASIYQDANLNDCNILLHLPLKNKEVSKRDFCTIFRSRQDLIGLLLMSRMNRARFLKELEKHRGISLIR